MGRMIALMVAAVLAGGTVWAQEDVAAIVAGLKSEDGAARRTAQEEAVKLGAPVIAPLCELIAEDTPIGVSMAGKTLEAMVGQATASGNEGYRASLEAALAKQANSARAERARALVIRALGLVGQGPKAAYVLHVALLNERTFEPAREALERMSGEEATYALWAAVGLVPAEQRPRLIRTLGAHRDPEALRALMGLAATPTGAEGVAALEALGQIGDASAVKTLLGAAERGAPEAREAAVKALMVLADAQMADDPALARRLYRRSLDLAPTGRQRSAALIGLCRNGYSAAPPLLIRALEDEETKATALMLLQGMPREKLRGRTVPW